MDTYSSRTTIDGETTMLSNITAVGLTCLYYGSMQTENGYALRNQKNWLVNSCFSGAKLDDNNIALV